MLSFVEQRDFDDPGIDDLTPRIITSLGTRRARIMTEAGAGIRARPIKCEHTVKHYCFLYIDCLPSKFFPPCLRQAAKIMLQHPTMWFNWKQSKYGSTELLLYDFLHKRSTGV